LFRRGRSVSDKNNAAGASELNRTPTRTETLKEVFKKDAWASFLEARNQWHMSVGKKRNRDIHKLQKRVSTDSEQNRTFPHEIGNQHAESLHPGGHRPNLDTRVERQPRDRRLSVGEIFDFGVDTAPAGNTHTMLWGEERDSPLVGRKE